MSQSPTPRPVKVSLLSHTAYPLETMYIVWMQSREDRDEWFTPQALANFLEDYTCPFDTPLDRYIDSHFRGLSNAEACMAMKAHFDETVQMLVHEAVPVAECVEFVFLLENVSISLREQLVRHRIGSRLGPRLGVDIAPDVAESSWWSQTSRVVPYDRFYRDGRFIVPDSLEGKRVVHPIDGGNDSAEDAYLHTLWLIEAVYNALSDAGVPLEDCRNLIPLAATHSITWTCNLKSLAHILGKRTSWIAQMGIWEPVIAGIAEALAQVSPFFTSIFRPKCFKGNKYIGCPVAGTNRERIIGTDGDMPPCPVYIAYETEEAIGTTWDVENPAWQSDLDWEASKDIRVWNNSSPRSREMLMDNAKRYERLWQMPVFVDAVATAADALEDK